MALTRTEAVVLKSTDYSESSRIYRLYTLDFGLQSLIAKGVRRPENRLRAALERLNHIEVIYYKSPNRNLYTLSQASIIDAFRSLATDIHRFCKASAVAEMVLKLGAEEEGNTEVFRILVQSLRAFSRRPLSTLGERMISYIWGIFSACGYAPRVDSCVRCGKTANARMDAPFSIREGGVICSRCGGEKDGEVSPLSIKMARAMTDRGAGTVLGLDAAEEEAMLRLTEEYLRYHVHEQKPIASWELLRSLRSEAGPLVS